MCPVTRILYIRVQYSKILYITTLIYMTTFSCYLDLDLFKHSPQYTNLFSFKVTHHLFQFFQMNTPLLWPMILENKILQV